MQGRGVYSLRSCFNDLRYRATMNSGMTPKNFSLSISEGLDTTCIGQNVIYYPGLPSTMDEARRLAQQGAVGGTVIIADEQTKGRGRMQRQWLTPANNIAISIVLYPDINALPYLIMIASLAAARGIEAVTHLKTQIKWPNDILIGGKKVCGILIENELKGNQAAFSVVGIGINIALRSENFAEIANTATALNNEAGKDVNRVDIIRSLLEEFELLYLSLPEGNEIFNMWRDKLITLGKKVTVTCGNDTLEGIAESVDRSGAILLRHSTGSLTRVVAGDVTLREQ